jgi:serine/threonine protein kinase
MGDSPEYVRLHQENVSWLVAQEYRDRFILADRLGVGDGEVLRATPHRRVVRLQGTKPLIVKHFYHGGIVGILKALLRGTPAEREWDALAQAQHRGLPAAKPVALGQEERFTRRRSLLVTESLEGGVPLNDFLFGSGRIPRPRKRRQAVQEVAFLIRKAHDLGFYQRDLHLGNILLREKGETLEAFLIDLQRVKVGAALSPRRRWHNLAMLQGGSTEASQTDRLRFLKHYLVLAPPLPFDLRGLATEIEKEGRQYRFKLWRSRQKRCLAENREFVQIRLGAFHGFARRERWENLFASLLSKGESFLQLPGAELVKDSNTTTVAVAGPGASRFYIKRYNYQGPAYAAKDLLRSARARRTWMAANSLHMRGIPVALPLLYLERRGLGILRESYFFTAARSGVTVRDIFRGYDKLGYRFHEKRILLDQLARLLRTMHARGVAHRDLKGSNIMAQATPGGTYDLSIVDFDGIRLGPVSQRRRIKNLARAAVECHRHSCFTRTDRLRFLKTYLGSQEVKRWKPLWLSVTRQLSGSGFGSFWEREVSTTA